VLYYAPPPPILAQHTSVAPRAGIRSGVLRKLMLLALPHALGQRGMANGELRVGKGGLYIIMPRRFAVDYIFSREHGNLVLLVFSRCCLCSPRATNSCYILTFPGGCVCVFKHTLLLFTDNVSV
jgi:hypothetical protein